MAKAATAKQLDPPTPGATANHFEITAFGRLTPPPPMMSAVVVFAMKRSLRILDHGWSCTLDHGLDRGPRGTV